MPRVTRPQADIDHLGVAPGGVIVNLPDEAMNRRFAGITATATPSSVATHP